MESTDRDEPARAPDSFGAGVEGPGGESWRSLGRGVFGFGILPPLLSVTTVSDSSDFPARVHER